MPFFRDVAIKCLGSSLLAGQGCRSCMVTQQSSSWAQHPESFPGCSRAHCSAPHHLSLQFRLEFGVAQFWQWLVAFWAKVVTNPCSLHRAKRGRSHSCTLCQWC